MKIVEHMTPDNVEKVFIGPKEIKLTYDTETEKVAVNTPAIWGGDVEVSMSALRDTLDKLEARTTYERHNGDAPKTPKVKVKDLELGDQFYWDERFYKVIGKNDAYIEVLGAWGEDRGKFHNPIHAGEGELWSWNTEVDKVTM